MCCVVWQERDVISIEVLQRLNSLFATGELPTLFSNDEMNGILQVSSSSLHSLVSSFHLSLSLSLSLSLFLSLSVSLSHSLSFPLACLFSLFLSLSGTSSLDKEGLCQRGNSSHALFHCQNCPLPPSRYLHLTLLSSSDLPGPVSPTTHTHSHRN